MAALLVFRSRTTTGIVILRGVNRGPPTFSEAVILRNTSSPVQPLLRQGGSQLSRRRHPMRSNWLSAMTANPSLNADVPGAGLRPRSGPPVS